MQLLCLQHPKVLDCLGLPEMNGSAIPVKIIGSSGVADIVITKEGEISAQTLSPDDLVSVSDVLAFYYKILFTCRIYSY